MLTVTTPVITVTSPPITVTSAPVTVTSTPITVTSINTVTVTSIVTVSSCLNTTTGVNENEKTVSQVQLYPVPTANYLTITFQGVVVKHVQIYNTLGVKVIDVPVINGGTIDMSSLPIGIYSAKTMNGTALVSIHKVIVNR